MKKLMSIIWVILGNILYAVTVKCFLLPANLITGGTTGIALAVQRLSGISVSHFVLIFNIIMLLAGWIILGKKFALTTIISTFTYPMALGALDMLLGNLSLTDDLWLNTLFSGLGIGVSLGIVIRSGASTGGMDIPPLILNRYFHIPVSLSLYVFDVLILLLQAVHHPAEKILYGILLVLIYTLVLDKILLLGTSKTEVRVVSKHYEEIREAIIYELDRGVTMLFAQSGYKGEKTQIVFTVISNRELPRVEKIVREIDPVSFIIVSRVCEVWGRGFSIKKEYR